MTFWSLLTQLSTEHGIILKILVPNCIQMYFITFIMSSRTDFLFLSPGASNISFGLAPVLDSFPLLNTAGL